ncbi:MAG TPA: hypothetical protein V6D07_18620 [Trichocoleus sp.]
MTLSAGLLSGAMTLAKSAFSLGGKKATVAVGADNKLSGADDAIALLVDDAGMCTISARGPEGAFVRAKFKVEDSEPGSIAVGEAFSVFLAEFKSLPIKLDRVKDERMIFICEPNGFETLINGIKDAPLVGDIDLEKKKMLFETDTIVFLGNVNSVMPFVGGSGSKEDIKSGVNLAEEQGRLYLTGYDGKQIAVSHFIPVRRGGTFDVTVPVPMIKLLNMVEKIGISISQSVTTCYQEGGKITFVITEQDELNQTVAELAVEMAAFEGDYPLARPIALTTEKEGWEAFVKIPLLLSTLDPIAAATALAKTEKTTNESNPTSKVLAVLAGNNRLWLVWDSPSKKCRAHGAASAATSLPNGERRLIILDMDRFRNAIKVFAEDSGDSELKIRWFPADPSKGRSDEMIICSLMHNPNMVNVITLRALKTAEAVEQYIRQAFKGNAPKRVFLKKKDTNGDPEAKVIQQPKTGKSNSGSKSKPAESVAEPPKEAEPETPATAEPEPQAEAPAPEPEKVAEKASKPVEEKPAEEAATPKTKKNAKTAAQAAQKPNGRTKRVKADEGQTSLGV